MKATFISKENGLAKFTMEFTADEFDAAIIAAYQKNKGRFVVDGFRRGKAPRKMIERYYGEDVFFEDAINDLFAAHYGKAVDELGLDIIDRPDADFTDLKAGEGFTVTITVAVYPEVEVKDYKGVEIAKVETTVTDEEVDNDIALIQKRNARMVVADRAAAEGDTVVLDYAGFVGEEQFEGGTAERQTLKLGSKTFIPGFEEQLVGVAAGESKDVVVTFPEEYHAPDLAGKEAVFKCTVHEVKTEELPELNDDFAKDVSEFDTLEEFKKDTKEKIEKAAAARAENEMKNAALEKVYEANNFEVPAVLVDNEIDQMMNEFDQQLRYQGMSLDQFFKFSGKEVAEFRNELREEAEKKVKVRMLITAIADKEDFVVTDEEVEEEMKAIADLYKIELEQVKTMLGNDDSLKKDLKARKAIDFVFENAVIK